VDPEDQLKLNGDVPPLTVKLADPSLPPTQFGSVPVIEALGAGNCASLLKEALGADVQVKSLSVTV
jgi:hypothetical protein